MRNRDFKSLWSAPRPNREMPFLLLAIAEIAARPGVRFANENYGMCTMELVVSGRGELYLGGERYELGPGDLYILHKGSTHEYAADEVDPWTKLYLNIDGQLMTDLFRAYGLSHVCVVRNAPVDAFFRDLLALAKEASLAIHDRVALIFHRWLITLSNHLHQGSHPYSPFVAKALQYIEQHVEQDLRMQDIAQHAGCSVAHLTRTFKQQVGQTPSAYHTMRRVEQAKLLLTSTVLSVKDIAARLNYGDEYYFSNAFKRVAGLAPSHYRESR